MKLLPHIKQCRLPVLTAFLLAGVSCSPPPKPATVLEPQAQIELLKTRPYESRALIPVRLHQVDGLGQLVLAEKGAANIVIVPGSGMPYYREVAEFLADYLKQATGLEFPIVNEPPTANREALFVGPVKTAGTERTLARAKELAPERFLVERVPGGVILVGNDTYRAIDTGKPLTLKLAPHRFGMFFCSKGTYFAAVDFLERFVGVRWYFWSPLGTCVPDLKGRTLAVPAVAYEDGPAFPCRNACGIELDVRAAAACGIDTAAYSRYFFTSEYRTWGNRNGAVRPARVNHTDCFWGTLYAKEHPEYFALRADGTRMVGENGKEMFSCQRCYTNEGGFRQHLRNIEEYLQNLEHNLSAPTNEADEAFAGGAGCGLGERSPNKEFIYWAPNDGFTGCACPDCQKLIDKNVPMDRNKSRLMWSYVAKLANAIKEKWPEKKLCVFGAYYGDSEIPADIKLPDNIIVDVTLMNVPDCYLKEPKYRQADQDLVDYFYRRTGQKVSLWIYPNLPFYSMQVPYPYRAPHAQAEFIRTNRDKLCAVRPLGQYAMNAPDLYARLLWNPDLDVDAFLAEYAAVMFGPAAAPMKQFMDLCVTRWENTHWSYLPPPIGLERAIPEQMIWKETYPREIRAQMQAYLNQALADVPDDTLYRKRVQYMTAVLAPFFDAGKFADETVKPVVDAVKFAALPTVDGDLAEWAAVPPTELRGWQGETVKEKTEFFIAYDAEALYVAGRAYESDGLVLPPDPKHDSIFRYDEVEMFFCPDLIGLEEAGMAKSEQFLQIALNARGETAVNRKKLGRIDWGPPEKFDFTSVVKPFGKGFQFEVRVPFASLGAPVPKEGHTEWLANFYRNRPRGEDKGYQAWSPTMGKPFFDTRCFGLLRFPPEPLYAVDFGTAGVSIQDWTEIPVPKDASWKLDDGRLSVKVKALPALSSAASTSVAFSRIPKLPLGQPVRVECVFRQQGTGLKAVSLCVKSSYDAAHHRAVAVKTLQILPEPATATGAWQRVAVRIPDGAVKLGDISYWDVSLQFEPGADFAVDLASLKVFPGDSP